MSAPTVIETTSGEATAVNLINALTSALPFASDDKTIPMINAVKVEGSTDGTLVAAATNRYVLGAYTTNYVGNAFDLLLSVDDVKTVVALLKRCRKDEPITLTLSLDRVTVRAAYSGVETTVRNIHEDHYSFPRWRSLIPDHDGKETTAVAFSPTYLALFAKVARARTEPMRMILSGDMRPAKVLIGESFVGLIMPMR